jgi:hypothetical protein
MQTYTVTVDEEGTTWRNELGQLHRELGPAVEYADDYRAWYVDGQLHRELGPAVEYADGSRSWFVNGRLHRTDGPAVELPNGYREYWVNGQELTKAEFEAQQTKELTVAKVEELLGHRVKIIG